MDTHDQQADRPAYLRGMPASLWIEATTGRQRTSGPAVQPSVVDVPSAPTFDDAAALELCETPTRNLPDRQDVTRRDGEE
jgi:hypothetical protein